MQATTSPSLIIRKQGDWLAARSGDEVMMMSAQQGVYLGLNRMGARIWDLLDTVSAADELCDRLLAEFDVTAEQCRAEVDAFLAELARHKAIEMVAR